MATLENSGKEQAYKSIDYSPFNVNEFEHVESVNDNELSLLHALRMWKETNPPSSGCMFVLEWIHVCYGWNRSYSHCNDNRQWHCLDKVTLFDRIRKTSGVDYIYMVYSDSSSTERVPGRILRRLPECFIDWHTNDEFGVPIFIIVAKNDDNQSALDKVIQAKKIIEKRSKMSYENKVSTHSRGPKKNGKIRAFGYDWTESFGNAKQIAKYCSLYE